MLWSRTENTRVYWTCLSTTCEQNSRTAFEEKPSELSVRLLSALKLFCCIVVNIFVLISWICGLKFFLVFLGLLGALDPYIHKINAGKSGPSRDSGNVLSESKTEISTENGNRIDP